MHDLITDARGAGTPVHARPASGRPVLARVLAVVATILLAALLASPTAGPAAAAPDESESAPTFARIDVETITPTMVTSTSPATVTVTGQVRNVGDRDITGLGVRLERGDAVSTADSLRTTLATEPMAVAVAGPFRSIADKLEPGQTTRFSLTMPLSDNGLQISDPGVYPLNVNLDGTPEYGGPARIAESAMLLPVLSLPADRTRAQNYVEPGEGAESPAGLGPDGSVAANVSSPSPMTLLWPLAAPPQLAPGVLGGGTEPVRLISEDMARSLSDGGRLHNLLTSLQSVVGKPDPDNPSASQPGSASLSGTSTPGTATSTPAAGADTDDTNTDDTGAAPAITTKLGRSLCLAIDPDLLVTVRAMSLGYVVSDNPADPTSATVPGTGQDAAAAWLTELQRISKQLCVVALPFAQADLDSLHRVGNDSLTAAALQSPTAVVDGILGVRSVDGLTIPAIGAMDANGAQVLGSAEITKAAASSGSVSPATTADGSQPADPSGRYQVGELHVQTTSAPITAAFAAIGTRPVTPVLTPAARQVRLDDESDVSRRQTALASMAFPSIDAPSDTSGSTATDSAEALPVTGRSSFIVPSTYWSPTDDDGRAILSTATMLLESGAAAPAPLADVVTDLERATRRASFVTPPDTTTPARSAWVVSAAQADRIRASTDLSWQLQTSLVRAADVNATPERYVAPLREDLLRALTSPGRNGSQARAELTATRTTSLDAVGGTLDRMRAAVTILDPGARYTLASERSPLLLVVRNDLALPIRVHIDTSAPTGIEVGDVGVVEIPARGTRQLQLPAQADSSEATTVTISLNSSTDIPLGTPITISIRSNAYGKPLFWITIAAGIALLLLVARRLWHRFRGEPDPADEDRPEPDELERMLAGSTYQHRRETVEQYERGAVEYPQRDDDPDPTDGPDPREKT